MYFQYTLDMVDVSSLLTLLGLSLPRGAFPADPKSPCFALDLALQTAHSLETSTSTDSNIFPREPTETVSAGQPGRWFVSMKPNADLVCFCKGYYHEFMLRGRFHLCRYMPRCKDARRLDADPTNEPDFYKISASFPVNDIVSPAVTQKGPVNNNSSSIPTLTGPIKQAVVPPSLGQDAPMAQLVAAIQALQNTNSHQAMPCPTPTLSAPSPQPASPPLEQLVALVSSVQTTASTPASSLFPVNNNNNPSNAMLPMLLQVLLASNGNLGTTPPPPPQGQPQPSKSNDPLGVLASLLQKQQQEQQEASARLALALALALNKA